MFLLYTQVQMPAEEFDEDILFYFQPEGWIYIYQENQGYQTEKDVQTMCS
jgi:hypothetical protein